MGELRMNGAAYPSKDEASPYARMIPGNSTVTRPGPVKGPIPVPDHGSAPGSTRNSTPPEWFAQIVLPHPTADPIKLYQRVFADLLALTLAGGLQGRLLPSWSLPQWHLPAFAVLVTLFAFTEGVYRSTPDPLPRGAVPSLVRAVVFAVVLVYVAGAGAMRPITIPVTTMVGLASVLGYRQVQRFAWARRKREEEPRRVLIVGASHGARALARGLHSDRTQRTVVRGFVDDAPATPVGVLGRIADLAWLARAEFIDEVILAVPGQPTVARVAAEIALRNHLDLRAVPDLPPGPWPEATVEYVGGVPLVSLHREPVPSAGLFLKHALDVAGAGLGLLLAAPLMAAVAVCIRLDSRGPIFYSAERIGAKGRRFRCYKFRSMVAGADRFKAGLRAQNERAGPTFKIADDPRITRVGRFIRRYSLDELPQLWNVLRGDMSLVGPRPHPVDDVNRYELHHYRRLDVKPGITGLWQISARRSPSFDLNMHLDLTYIENWNLWLDLRILCGTVRVLFSPEGA